MLRAFYNFMFVIMNLLYLLLFVFNISNKMLKELHKR